MNPWVIMAGAALGAVKHSQDKKDFQEQAHLASVKTRWSPWTGMKGEVGKRPSLMGSMMQGGLAGAGMAQQMGGDEKDGAPDAPEAPGVGDDGAQLTGDGEVGSFSDEPDEWGVPKKKRGQTISSSPGSTYSMGKRT